LETQGRKAERRGEERRGEEREVAAHSHSQA